MTNISLPEIRPDLDTLIDLALTTGGETHRFDFKELLDLGRDEHKVRLVRAVGSFCNTDEGGFVLIGISDDRRVVGLSQTLADKFDQTRVHDILAQYLTPPPSVQVRRHKPDGKELVVIEVASFVEVPSIVRLGAQFGDEKLMAGTFLYRSRGAKSGLLTAEHDVRALCDTLVKRRASAFLDLIQRASPRLPPPVDKDRFAALVLLEENANKVWPMTDGAAPFIGVCFSSGDDLRLGPEQLRSLIPGAAIPTRHGFPFHDVGGQEVHRPQPWGWFGRIPFAPMEATDPPPSYLWLLSRKGVFVHREGLWEDSPQSVVPGGVGLFHVLGNAILLIRFLNSFGVVLDLDSRTRFLVKITASQVRGRYLGDETRGIPSRFRKEVTDTTIESTLEVDLSQVRSSPRDVVLNLAEEMAWQFLRDDLRRHDLEEALKRAPQHLGPPYALT